MYIRRGQRWMSGVLLCHSPPCSLETESLPESGVRLAVCKPSNPPALPPTVLSFKIHAQQNLTLHVGAGDLNPRTHAYAASSLTHLHSLQHLPLAYFLHMFLRSGSNNFGSKNLRGLLKVLTLKLICPLPQIVVNLELENNLEHGERFCKSVANHQQLIREPMTRHSAFRRISLVVHYIIVLLFIHKTFVVSSFFYLIFFHKVGEYF